jgi:3-hydroxyisobutyrate dehydrogenase-like beta-hydroxyacid dehydrogenase
MTVSQDLVVGFVGLGNMGAPMAANIAAAGYPVIGFDAAGTDGRLPGGCESADSIDELVGRADTVMLSVPDGAVTLTIADQIAAADGRRARVVIDLSTVGPVAAQEAARRFAELGISYVDGPVSGGVAGARARTIALMFGGPTEVFEAHRHLLGSFAGNVFHVGERAGHGQAMKLLNNFLSATALAASSEALALGRAYGLDMQTMLDVVNVSTGRNSATADKFPNRVLTGTYDTGFFTHLMAKDVRLFNSVAAEVGTAHAVSAAVGGVWNACEQALPGSDFSEIWKFVSGDADAPR